MNIPSYSFPATEHPLAELRKEAGLTDDPSVHIAKSEDGIMRAVHGRLIESHIRTVVVLVPATVFPEPPQCLHRLYFRCMRFFNGNGLLPGNTRTLFYIAALLKKNILTSPGNEKVSCSIVGFAGARPCTRQLLNHKEGTAVDMHDLSSPVLFVENGVPGSIYRHLHADSVPEETYLAVSSTYFTPGNTVEMIKRAMEEIIATVPA